MNVLENAAKKADRISKLKMFELGMTSPPGKKKRRKNWKARSSLARYTNRAAAAV